MRRGEVWWVERPEAGRRPHLVLTRDPAIERLRTVLGVPTTRTIRGIPSEVELGPDDGMPDRCVLSLDNTRVLPKAYFVERICTRIFIINHGRQVTSGTSAEIRAAADAATLEEAFSRLTGVRDVGEVTADFLASLERV